MLIFKIKYGLGCLGADSLAYFLKKPLVTEKMLLALNYVHEKHNKYLYIFFNNINY